MNNIVIKLEDVSKLYRLGVIGHGTLSRDMQSWWARLRGKEDPNAVLNSQTSDLNEEFWALKDVSFEVKQGEIVGVIGHNGAGKSTLLKILSRVTAPTTGTIKIKGKIASLLEVGTGFHPELTGRENVYLNGSILGMTKNDIKSKFDEIVEFSEIGKFIDTPVKRYSSGMYVRLAFAVAAHLDPEIMIIDEVLAVGDSAFQKKCLTRVERLGEEEGRTVFFVSHNLGAVSSICSRAILFEKGRVVVDGSVQEVVDKYHQSMSQGGKQGMFRDLSDCETRQGPGDFARFQSIGLSNLNDEPADVFKFGEGMKVRLKLRFFRPARSPEVGIAITNMLGQRVTHIVSAWEGVANSVDEDNYIYEVTIPKLNIVPGTYSIIIWVKKEWKIGSWDDGIRSALNFQITEADIDGRLPYFEYCQAGEVYIPSQWKVEKTS